MAYHLNAVTIRTNNSPAGMQTIQEIWRDIMSGALPLLFDSDHQFQQEIFPVAMYHNYETDQTGDYDLSVIGVTAEVFQQLEEAVRQGRYKKFEITDRGGDLGLCTQLAWKAVWDAQGKGELQRAFTADYERTVPPAYSEDGTARCSLYIALQGEGGPLPGSGAAVDRRDSLPV